MELIRELAQELSQDQREDVPVSKLKIAFKCGGSDAFSGVTANPLCGRIADCITALDGSAVLTEVPEMFGAETILMNRSDLSLIHISLPGPDTQGFAYLLKYIIVNLTDQVCVF